MYLDSGISEKAFILDTICPYLLELIYFLQVHTVYAYHVFNNSCWLVSMTKKIKS